MITGGLIAHDVKFIFKPDVRLHIGLLDKDIICWNDEQIFKTLKNSLG